MELRSSPASQKAVDRAVSIGLVAIGLMAALDELSRLKRRSARSMNLWWERVDHRQRRAWRRGEAAFLVRRIRGG